MTGTDSSARLTPMQDLVFESTRMLTQEAFGVWVRERSGWDLNHYELLQGRVTMTPPAGYPHGEIEANVLALLHAFAKPRALGRVFGSSQGYDLPSGDTLEPDVSFVSTRRWQEAPTPEEGKFLRVVPDLVVEILSAATAARDRGAKKAAYEASGVLEYWLVDRGVCEVVRFVRGAQGFGEGRAFRGEELMRSEVLEGLEFPVRVVFP
jgi:Uma2 family endonuclease